ncbi:alkyl hydroperoxide reductase/ thiol specific antioxidant/ Mal allergen [Jimgerdemannia flammicorona]|uniref:thioredoxin-dependent peroxiredoxin n=1 Tax=Jimgerdemannia flammicorona TaxID=994334 RepID=A0A433QXD6_9FUNG|nr:alkyl hydroperoxide reductase/ thiol specific antioxidant/ Mal allergen [Jimgerdemannia flammicorona]
MSHALIGQPGPTDFVGKNQRNEDVNLAEVIGQQPVVLFFYPRDESPNYTREGDYCASISVLCLPKARRDRDRRVSSPTSASRLNFTLLSDDKSELRKAYQVPKTLGLLPGRVTFIIARDGTVRDVFNSHLDVDGYIKKAIELLPTL